MVLNNYKIIRWSTRNDKKHTASGIMYSLKKIFYKKLSPEQCYKLLLMCCWKNICNVYEMCSEMIHDVDFSTSLVKTFENAAIVWKIFFFYFLIADSFGSSWYMGVKKYNFSDDYYLYKCHYFWQKFAFKSYLISTCACTKFGNNRLLCSKMPLLECEISRDIPIIQMNFYH